MSTSQPSDRDKPNIDSLNVFGQKIYEWFEANCESSADKCDPFPRNEVLQRCQMTQFAARVVPGKFTGNECNNGVIDEAFKEYCKGPKSKVSGCYKFYPTTPKPSTSTLTSSTPKSQIPMIIGCVAGGVLILLILIICVWCSRAKKSTPLEGGKTPTKKSTTTGASTTKTKGLKTRSTYWV